MSGERPEERWLPTQSVATIMLSVVSMLNDPNFSSPANVDASVRSFVAAVRVQQTLIHLGSHLAAVPFFALQVQWRKDMPGYKRKIKEIIAKANAEFDGHIKIPHPDTNEDERAKAIERIKELNKPMDLYDEFDDYGDDAEEDFEDDFEDGDDDDFEDGDEEDDDEGSD